MTHEDIDDDPQLPTQTGAAQRDPAEARRIGQAVREATRGILDDWNGPGLSADERALHTGIEAQIAASCLGTKPLYFEPWGEDISLPLADALRPRLPADVTVAVANGNLLVYRPEIVRPILDSDVAFYRPDEEDDAAAVARISALGENGELLGYGERNFLQPQGARVLLTTEAGHGYMWFVSGRKGRKSSPVNEPRT